MDTLSRRRLLMHHKWQRRWAWQSLGLHVCLWLGAAMTLGVYIVVAPHHYTVFDNILFYIFGPGVMVNEWFYL